MRLTLPSIYAISLDVINGEASLVTSSNLDDDLSSDSDRSMHAAEIKFARGRQALLAVSAQLSSSLWWSTVVLLVVTYRIPDLGSGRLRARLQSTCNP